MENEPALTLKRDVLPHLAKNINYQEDQANSKSSQFGLENNIFLPQWNFWTMQEATIIQNLIQLSYPKSKYKTTSTRFNFKSLKSFLMLMQ